MALLARLKEGAARQYVPSYWIALVCVGLRENDEAFDWLERAYGERSSWLVWAGVEPRFDGVRPDPRFAMLLTKIGLDRAGAQEHKEGVGKAISMLASMRSLRPTEFRVVGEYTRHDEATRCSLKDLKRKLLEGLRSSGPRHENYLIWAPPGSGMTFLVQQVAAAAGAEVDCVELNLAQADESDFRSALERGREEARPSLWLTDEIDGKEGASWPYEALLPHLDRGAEAPARRVYVRAGSSGSSIDDFHRTIALHPKGTDMLSRVPHENVYSIPRLTPEDRILVTVTTPLRAAKRAGRETTEVEKLALCFVASSLGLSSARQLREFALRCIDRIPASEDRVRFDNLFDPGDSKYKSFWLEARSGTPELVDSLVHLELDGPLEQSTVPSTAD